MEQKFYTPDEIADLLQMHPKTIRRYIREGKIKATKIGKGWRVSGHDLSVFTEGMTQVPAASDEQAVSAKVSAVVDIAMQDAQDVMRIINFVTSAQQVRERSFVTLNGQYLEKEGVFRLMLWGSLLGVQQLLADIQHLIDEK